jgi:hypothetical protein
VRGFASGKCAARILIPTYYRKNNSDIIFPWGLAMTLGFSCRTAICLSFHASHVQSMLSSRPIFCLSLISKCVSTILWHFCLSLLRVTQRAASSYDLHALIHPSIQETGTGTFLHKTEWIYHKDEETPASGLLHAQADFKAPS